jgi:hypothetical protein
MYQAILTKFIGPSDRRGSRVKATAEAGSVTIDWNHALNPERNHAAAARALALKYGWRAKYHGGGMPQGAPYAYAFVAVDKDDLPTFEITASEVAA